jgi:uncharacterized membrane protein YdjX (TVP38/TMEM64 family)
MGRGRRLHGTYVAVVAISFPGAGFLTIAGGFLFGWVWGSVLAVLSATAGRHLIFLIARTSVGDCLSRRAGPRLLAAARGISRRTASATCCFCGLRRCFPFFPGEPGRRRVRHPALPYVAATAIGILPGNFILAYFGEGLRRRSTVPARPFGGTAARAGAAARLWRSFPSCSKWRRGKGRRSQAIRFPE